MSYLFDNNLSPQLARALRLLGKETLHVQEITELGSSATDDLILDHAGGWGHVLVTRDRAMIRTPQYRSIITSKRLGVLVVRTGGARQLGAWQIAQLVVRAWDNIELCVSTTRPPFVLLVQANGRVVPYRA